MQLKIYFDFIKIFFLTLHFSVPRRHHTKIATVRLFPRSNIKLRRSIVRLHNKYRASVVPSASNMLRMVNINFCSKFESDYDKEHRLSYSKCRRDLPLPTHSGNSQQDQIILAGGIFIWTDLTFSPAADLGRGGCQDGSELR